MSAPSPKGLALALWEELNREASDARDSAEQHRLAELAAFHDDDAATAEVELAQEYVSRGRAIGLEEAAFRVRVKLLAAVIPEETAPPAADERKRAVVTLRQAQKDIATLHDDWPVEEVAKLLGQLADQIENGGAA